MTRHCWVEGMIAEWPTDTDEDGRYLIEEVSRTEVVFRKLSNWRHYACQVTFKAGQAVVREATDDELALIAMKRMLDG